MNDGGLTINGIRYIPAESIIYKHNGMFCPKCGSDNNKVKDSRHSDKKKIRRRECINCGTRWSTIETLIEYSVDTRVGD